MTVAAHARRKFLVTGATGYLGPWLAREIIHQFGPGSLSCLIPKVLPPLEQKSLAYLRRLGVECRECNLMKCPVLEGALPSVDVLIHMAANTRTDLPEHDLQVNTAGTANLLDTFSNSLNGKRVLLTSTSAAIDRDSLPRAPLTEDSPARPRTGYGRTKLQAETIVQKKSYEYGFDYTTLRLTTLYGPGMRGGLFYVLAEWAIRGRVFARINWPGRASFIFVEDAARIVLWFSSAEAGRNQTYFVSSGETYTIGKLADLISKERTGRPSQLSLPHWFWKMVQRFIWFPGVKQVIPWRLANVIDDSLLCDSSRMRRIYPGMLTTVDVGLSRTFGPDSLEDELARALA
jgi:nucleoside-diphosphate-sugar epimerase